jgi:hypothetical protein
MKFICAFLKKLKSFPICAGFLASCSLAGSLDAHEVISCKSPDGKFALRCVYADSQPYNGEAAIIELATHKKVFSLNPNWTLSQVKLVWSPDSQRVAYFGEKDSGYSTRVFSRNGSSFNEIPLPELPSPKLPENATSSEADTNTRVEPINWIKPTELLLEKELINAAWGRAALRFTLAFDPNNPLSIRNVEQEKVSIIDYFLLLPPQDFEAPLSAWLRMMRGNDYFPCDIEPEHNIDEKNGYMYCRGDGAQPSFEVALFRYRDARPLLALCSGQLEAELEGDDSTYLRFFEIGADNRMHEIQHSILPGLKRKYDPELEEGRGELQFVLPRKGKTILVRAPKSKKTLHKFTWDSEKFQEEK